MNKLVRGGAVGTAAGAVLLALAAPVSAAPGWRVVAVPDKPAKRYDSADLTDVAAISAKEAWAVGNVSAAGGHQPVVRRWNGRTWSRVALPAAAKNAVLFRVSASSSRNVWVGGGTNDRLFWLHWNGRSWKTVSEKRARSEYIHSAEPLALGERDVWSFGRGDGHGLVPDVRHFDGKRWRKVKAPGVIRNVNVVSRKEIWATAASGDTMGGPGTEGIRLAVVRWDGRSWKQHSTPFGKRTTANVAGLVASGGRDIWLSGSEDGRRGLLMHWNGRKWTKTYAPGSKGELENLVRDGSGGLWANDRGRLFRYKAGKWTSLPFPHPKNRTIRLQSLAHIPKTTSVWGVGLLEDTDVNQGNVILKYGK